VAFASLGVKRLTDLASCEIGDDRRVVCWDLAGHAHAELEGAIGLAADRDGRFCAARSDGTAWCWGRNLDSELGDGTSLDANRPRAVVRGW
jgi:hypothetical protein